MQLAASGWEVLLILECETKNHEAIRQALLDFRRRTQRGSSISRDLISQPEPLRMPRTIHRGNRLDHPTQLADRQHVAPLGADREGERTEDSDCL